MIYIKINKNMLYENLQNIMKIPTEYATIILIKIIILIIQL